MTSNDNSVNIKSDAYHHGDLRAALVRAGVEELDGGSAFDDLSLRGLARSVGVSATAVYRHFPDKAALLDALATAGLDRMAERQQAAVTAALTRGEDARGAFCASGAAYVGFALDHPELFRLIWRVAPQGDVLGGPCTERHPAMADLRAGIDSILPTDAPEPARRAAALACWALVHGLATLALDKQVALDDALIDSVIRDSLYT